MTDATTSEDRDEPAGEYSARELAELSGTTVRTIHYYASEGLLPPPSGSTRGASYSDGHLARLRIIAALRDEGLSLGKIRERLAPLTDEQAIRIATALSEHLASGDQGPLTPLGLIDLELARENLPAGPLMDDEPLDLFGEVQATYQQIAQPPAAPMVAPHSQPLGSARGYIEQLLQREQRAMPRPQLRTPSQPLPQQRPPAASEPPEVWYQYELDDGIELRLRADRFHQIKGRPNALIDVVRLNLRRYNLLRTPDDPEDDTIEED